MTENKNKYFHLSPWRIVEDCGAAFAMGTIGGSIFHGIKGYRNSASGYKRRFAGGFSTIRQKATVTGANFAAWGGMFSVVDCSLAYIRQKEDPWLVFTPKQTAFIKYIYI